MHYISFSGPSGPSNSPFTVPSFVFLHQPRTPSMLACFSVYYMINRKSFVAHSTAHLYQSILDLPCERRRLQKKKQKQNKENVQQIRNLQMWLSIAQIPCTFPNTSNLHQYIASIVSEEFLYSVALEDIASTINIVFTLRTKSDLYENTITTY